MSFTFDENNAGVEQIKPGEYEVYPNAYSVDVARSGNQVIQLNYFIRDDVQQPSAGQDIRYDNFTVTANAQWRFNALAKAVGTPQGFDFGTPEGWAKAMMGKPVRVVVGMEKDLKDKNKEWPRVKSFKNAQVPMNVQPVYKQSQQQSISNAANNLNNQFGSQTQSQSQQNFNQDPFSGVGQTINISDDDMPF